MAAQKAAPYLQPGEQIEMTVHAKLGSVSVKRFVATAAVVAVATAGLLTAYVHPRNTYLLLTGERLMVFDGETAIGRPGKLLFTLPREAVSVVRVKNGVIQLKVDLAVQGQDKGLRLGFPPAARKDGRQVVAALQSVASEPSGRGSY
jgi:hypothetical protein